MQRNKDIFQKAKEYAFLLLKFRRRSEKEIAARLKQRKFNQDTIKKAISFLKEKDFINDESFAQAWIESRLKRPLGLERIKQELLNKGIDKKIISHQLEALKKNYSEQEIVTKIIQQRLLRLRGIEPQKAKQRLYAYLLRRGYSAGIVNDAMEEL